MSLVCSENSAVVAQGDWRPTKLTLGNQAIFEPNITTVAGEGSVVIPNTYNDVCRLVKVTGKCVQDGVPSSDEPVEISCVGWTVTARGKNQFDLSGATYTSPQNGVSVRYDPIEQTITLNGTTTSVANMVFENVQVQWNDGDTICFSRWLQSGTITLPSSSAFVMWSIFSSDTTKYTARIEEYHTKLNESVIAKSGTAFSYDGYRLYIQCLGEAGIVFDNVVIKLQLETGSTATDYQPYYDPTTIDLPDLYAVGDVADVMYVDHEQGRAWVERKIDPELLVDTEFVDAQARAIWDEAIIEELGYTALPTFPKYTVIEADSDIAPEITVAALVYTVIE